MTRATCFTCIFWNGTVTTDIAYGDVKVSTFPGQCRARPPEKSGWWPATKSTDWCGGHTGHNPKVEDLFAIGARA